LFDFDTPVRRTAALAGVLMIFAAAAAAQPVRGFRQDQADLALATLSQARTQGLDPSGFRVDEATNLLHSAEPTQQARGQDLLRASLLAYAKSQHGGRVDRGKLPENWAIRPSPYDAAGELDQALAQDHLAAWVQDQPPPFEGYGRLLEARARYEAILAAGGWSVIPEGPSLKPGSKGPRVEALRRRLAVEDPATPAAQSQLYDKPLAEAVARAQARYGLNMDGAAGASTIAALNVSAEQRLNQIDVNLERWRWLPRSLPPDRLEVNIPAATLDAFQGGKISLSMRTIVGRPTGETPSFQADVETIVFYPPWNIPSTIARKEIWPKERKHPGYMAHERISVKSDGSLVQKPGPKNSLGLVKFDLPNPFTVYLHDTPSRSLFAKDVRTLSHGCMRLEKPYDLAKLLLKDDADWPAARIDSALQGGATIRAPLKTPTPVFVIYRSAFVDGQGQMNFRSDVYGWDEQLQGLLAAGGGGSGGLAKATLAPCGHG
jgi:murein L,D-transpeptidase YcbB/YkuD